nr:hypothetical protein [Tanacetum cinerariifolium]
MHYHVIILCMTCYDTYELAVILLVILCYPMYLHIHDFPEILMNLHDMLYFSYPCFTCSAVFVITYILAVFLFMSYTVGESMCFFDFPACFSTLCLLDYALMIRHDYDITSSLRRGALQSSRVGCLPSNTIANPKGKLKVITIRSGIFLDGPFVHIAPPFINPEEDERVEETLTDQDVSQYTIKNSLNDSPNIFDNSSQSPTHINHHCCYECGDSLDGIFCHQCTYESCGKGAHYGYNCPPKVPVISNPEPCNNQTIDELPQTLPIFDPTFYSGNESPFTCDSTPNIVDYSPNVFNPPPQPPNVENLVPNLSEYEGEHECDVPACDDFITFSNLLFDVDNDFSSSDNQSFYDEDISKEIYSNPLFDEEIISMKIDPHHFNAESDPIESLLNHDSLIISSFSNIDSLLDEFVGELTLPKSIPPGINETDCDHEEETHLIKRLLYDNSSPRPMEEFISKNSDAAIKSFSPSPIPIKDSDSFMEEIDLSFTSDDPMPPGIEEDDYDSKRDILILA